MRKRRSTFNGLTTSTNRLWQTTQERIKTPTHPQTHADENKHLHAHSYTLQNFVITNQYHQQPSGRSSGDLTHRRSVAVDLASTLALLQSEEESSSVIPGPMLTTNPRVDVLFPSTVAKKKLFRDLRCLRYFHVVLYISLVSLAIVRNKSRH